MFRSLALSASLLLSTLGSGCAAYRMETPTGFAQVSHSRSMAHYKASNDVGLNVRVFGNVEGGTLDFWSEDLNKKLTQRGYTLEKTAPVKSRNGITGRRLDFSYAPDDETQKAYSVVLFATDDHRVVVQLAGDTEAHGGHAKRLEALATGIKVRGCKLRNSICS